MRMHGVTLSTKKVKAVDVVLGDGNEGEGYRITLHFFWSRSCRFLIVHPSRCKAACVIAC
jgi:hypothetical protein